MEAGRQFEIMSDQVFDELVTTAILGHPESEIEEFLELKCIPRNC